MAAAQIARRDPQCGPRQRSGGGMVNLLVRDIATFERGRNDFPFVRNFDPYEGRSWARGNSQFFGHGTIESSPEAIHAWAAIPRGHFTGNVTSLEISGLTCTPRRVRSYNTGSTSMAIFLIPSTLNRSPVWPGGAYGYSTWWTEDPRQTAKPATDHERLGVSHSTASARVLPILIL